MKRLRTTSLIILMAGFAAAQPADTQPSKWYQGTTHVHTLNSDGDSTPDDVVRWYREHGYNFVFLTDHEMITNVAPLNALFGSEGKFVVLPAEEVTSNFQSPELHVHVNALDPKRKIAAVKGNGARDTLQQDVNAVTAAGGLAQINHPNFFWQLTADDIASINGATLMEIANAQIDVNNLGAGPDFPGTEEMWDRVLSSGKAIWGIASDDAHAFKEKLPEADWPLSKPGGGWIMVRAGELTLEAILSALRAGDFYASTGVTLEEYQVRGKQISIRVKPRQAYQEKYRIQFIGKNGKVLQDKTTESAAYTIRGDEGYVRARVVNSNGGMAWTQPVFTDGRKLP